LKWGDEQFANFIFWLSLNHFALCIHGEYAKQQKNEGKLSTSQLIMVQQEKNCRAFLSQPDGLD
jgi:hypothetical protein